MKKKTRLPIEKNPIFWTAKVNIPLWKIALKVEVTEMTLIRWLRVEMDDSRLSDVLKAIEEIKKEQMIV